MKKQGVNRLIVCSSLGVGPGNRSLLPWAVRGMLYHPLADKDDQEAMIVASGVDYTIVRPPRLMDKPPLGVYDVVESGNTPHNEIARADVAHFMLKCLYDKLWVKQTPHISWKAPQK